MSTPSGTSAQKTAKKAVQSASAGNMKRTWCQPEVAFLPTPDETLREATHIKNIWIPWGA
jgi:aldehyde dehydrogenase (NAD+)